MTDAADVAADVVGDSGAEWRLRDQRDFLWRSLEDADQEHAAGDLDDDDYRALRRRDEERLAAVEAELASMEAAALRPDGPPRADPPGAGGDAVGPASAATRSRRRHGRRIWLAVVGVACVIAAAVVLVVALVSPRLPGQAATGSIDLNAAQKIERQLSDAQTLVNHGNSSEALGLYGQVLAEDPRDPVALAEWGWLDWQAATTDKLATVAAEGASAEVEAVRLDKKLFAAQYYLATILYQEGDPAKAVTHYAAFLADHPPATWLAKAAPTLRAAYAAAHVPLPSGVPAAAPSPAGSGSTGG